MGEHDKADDGLGRNRLEGKLQTSAIIQCVSILYLLSAKGGWASQLLISIFVSGAFLPFQNG